MRPSRRGFLRLAASAAALPAIPRFAWAKTYPTRLVRIIVVAAAGGGSDILARLIGQWLSQRLGQPFVVENRPGGGGNIGTEAAVKAAPDGYTLLLVSSSHAINATLYDKLNFVFLRDIVPVASISRDPQIMVVNPSVPAASVPDFIAYAKARPGRINFASAGTGTGPHMAGELFKLIAGVDMVHVPYRGGGPALADLIGGQTQLMFPGLTAAIAYVRAGTLRPLAVTTAARLQVLPEIPTVGEFVPGYEASAVFGLGAPTGTPAEVVNLLNQEVNAGLADPRLSARLADLGGSAFPNTPTEFTTLLANETEKWGKVVRAANIKLQ